MKKLMFAIAALAAGAAMADVTSANIVGYNQNSTGGAQSFSGGAMFLPVNGEDYTLLGDWLAKNMNANLDKIQLLRTSNATTEKSYTYVDRAFLLAEYELDPTDKDDMEYLDELEAEYKGWWVAGSWGMEDAEANDAQIDCGRGFLTLNGSGKNVTFQYNGEAPTARTKVTISGQTPMVCNYIPRDIKLAEVTVENMNANLDCFQKLRTTNATTEEAYTYVSRAFLLAEYELDPTDKDDMEYLDELEEEYAGWWLAGSWGMEDAEAGDKDWKCGESFLGLMPSKVESGSMVVLFPSSIPAAE